MIGCAMSMRQLRPGFDYVTRLSDTSLPAACLPVQEWCRAQPEEDKEKFCKEGIVTPTRFYHFINEHLATRKRTGKVGILLSASTDIMPAYCSRIGSAWIQAPMVANLCCAERYKHAPMGHVAVCRASPSRIPAEIVHQVICGRAL